MLDLSRLSSANVTIAIEGKRTRVPDAGRRCYDCASIGKTAMTPMLRVIAIVLFAALAASLCTPAFAASALERASHVIQNKQFVDLTHSFDATTPVWSGFGQARMTPAADPKTKKTASAPSKDWDSNPERFKRSPFPAWAFETIKFL